MIRISLALISIGFVIFMALGALSLLFIATLPEKWEQEAED